MQLLFHPEKLRAAEGKRRTAMDPTAKEAGLDIQVLTGQAIAPFIDDLARLRVTVFRAFPYLYEGSPAYEERYIATYSRSPDSVFVLAIDDGRVVGAATGMPMADETEEVRAPFVAAGRRPEDIFYYGESVLLPDYRGQGVGVRFFKERERRARSLGRFSHAAFCAVERPHDHEARPEGYVPLDEFWRRRGFEPASGMKTAFTWRDVGDEAESTKPMAFWIKRLA